MIAEALEAAWVVVGVVAVTVGLYAVVVAGWGIWRAVVAVIRRCRTSETHDDPSSWSGEGSRKGVTGAVRR
ncbi:hypothetical protein [Streptomyces stelliscabiei]|uniref:Uncharacterized protein n=1 Tax=Streptomyces stelliscabiei TaxID=146820 RepID=A0A8I0TTE0_9ACTN|nr:hypothetical protein [Streptomyces stelliscabiei]KND45322.1 hypothetical protein IQ64_07535 [Streptomyces stelliscabiei]MBE1597173.1 hypothetical protein [Streptomyces stelliscabiei]